MAKQARKQNAGSVEFSEQQFFSRRKFLENSGKAALAATLLAGCTKTIEYKQDHGENNNGNTNNPSIAIIGAGIAGLNAAFNLKQAGVTSTVYDANARAGGRMFTAQDILNPGLSTELGGEFIDSSHHDLRALAKYFNLPLLDLFTPSELQLQQNIYFFNGVSYSDNDFLQAISYYLPAIERDVNSLSDIIKYNSYSPVDAMFDNMNIEQYFDSIHLTGWLRELLLVAYLGEYGLNTYECNSINFLFLFGANPSGQIAVYGQSDERFKISGGNQRITDALYKSLSGAVQLNNRLVKIQSTANGYSLYFDNKQKPVKADIVLLTLPFTLLREVELNAALPKVKRDVIKNLSYGNNSKLMLGFNGKRWRTQYNSVGMCYADTGTQNFWDNSQLQPGSNGGLTVFLGGDDAVKLGSGDVNAQASKYLKKINKVFPGVETDYNGKAYRMIWPTYPFSKGSYSAWSVGQYTTIAGSEVETVGNLFFAGEHTSYNFQGYMNGGAASGRLAAIRILNRIGH